MKKNITLVFFFAMFPLFVGACGVGVDDLCVNNLRQSFLLLPNYEVSWKHSPLFSQAKMCNAYIETKISINGVKGETTGSLFEVRPRFFVNIKGSSKIEPFDYETELVREKQLPEIQMRSGDVTVFRVSRETVKQECSQLRGSSCYLSLWFDLRRRSEKTGDDEVLTVSVETKD